MFGPDWLVHAGVWRLLAVNEVNVDLPPSGDPAWDGLERHVGELVWRAARAASLVALGMALLGWTTDFWLVADNPPLHRMLTEMRGGAAVVCLLTFALFQYVPAARRHPVASVLPFAVLLPAFVAFELGKMGGVETQLFDFLMFAILLTVVAPTSLAIRIGIVAAMVAAMCAGFFGPYPAHRQHPFALSTVAFLLSVAAMVIVMGHAVYIGACRNFFQGQRIIGDAAKLRSLSESLEARVQEQTAELRRVYEDLQQVREDERARLSRDLHDELGQQLGALHYALAKTKLRAARDPASLSAGLDELASLLGGAHETTRRIARELHPPMLEQLGFSGACAWLAKSMSDRLGLALEWSGPPEDTACPQNVAVAAYRVLQEALTNVGKHAGASLVRIALAVDGDTVQLSVTDDGKGLPDTREGAGLGLVGMEQRAIGLGGRLVAEPAEGRGTRVSLQLPLAGPRSAAATA